ncbi:uncharacterized protein MELLADRAFT_96116 [Melampsora larici-populina 98AG31]|uniref:Glutamine amidotransferase type-2 domain-containing protein n=1 Tax=Melampsora larici-populina (strain 98AG31 / pathotype 3-4-7) TaxID=747676 RepID=F4SB12_MELLP|nr:uncharacterized protein MELLADRAFT_96116 [Melampsora larici-populina 98AG31]EGF98166.1 hypothetical protein MELLADRAFT_96116 [Melampsora larici-populina 98AG31]
MEDTMIGASEVDNIPIDPAQNVCKGQLRPGQILLVDTAVGLIVVVEELKHIMASTRPYKQ